MLPGQSKPGNDVPAEDERKRQESECIQLRLVETACGPIVNLVCALANGIDGLSHTHQGALTLRKSDLRYRSALPLDAVTDWRNTYRTIRRKRREWRPLLN